MHWQRPITTGMLDAPQAERILKLEYDAATGELLRAKGQTLEQIAAQLNASGYRTRRGKTFRATTVLRLLPVQPIPSAG